MCQHIHLQKNWYELGAVEVGLEVALMPANAYQDKKEGQDRVACMAAYWPVVHRPHRVYLPDVYAKALSFFYSGLNEERAFSPSMEASPSDRRSECRIKIFDFASIVRVTFQETGADLWESVEKMEREAGCHGVKVIQVWLKLGFPWVGAAVDVFRANGYFLGGILLRWFDKDGLLMQKLFCPPEWEGIQVYTERAERIFEIVRKDMYSVVSLKEQNAAQGKRIYRVNCLKPLFCLTMNEGGRNMTSASQQALEGLRDLTTLKWYVIPLLAVIFYIYTAEMKKARQTGNWDAIFAGLTLFGMDFINETWNGWVLYLTERSACWTTPGETALRTLVGWNIEIMFMFAISGIIFYNTLSQDRHERILGIPNQ